MQKFLGKNKEKHFDFVENTPDYAEIPAVNKSDNKAFWMLTTVKWKALEKHFNRINIIVANFDMQTVQYRLKVFTH